MSISNIDNLGPNIQPGKMNRSNHIVFMEHVKALSVRALHTNIKPS